MDNRLISVEVDYIMYFYGDLSHIHGYAYIPENQTDINHTMLVSAIEKALEKEYPISYAQASTNAVFRHINVGTINNRCSRLRRDTEQWTLKMYINDEFTVNLEDEAYICNRHTPKSKEAIIIPFNIEEA